MRSFLAITYMDDDLQTVSATDVQPAEGFAFGGQEGGHPVRGLRR